MEWRSLKEFSNYQFSDTGLVKKDGNYYRVSLHNGYPRVNLSNKFVSKRVLIHHVIAELFIGPRPFGQIVRHLDDDRENNHVSNLEYGTQKENMRDAVHNGKVSMGDDHWTRTHPEKVKRGEMCHKTKLTREQVNEIRSVEYYYGCNVELAKKYKVSRITISNIRNWKVWQWLPNLQQEGRQG